MTPPSDLRKEVNLSRYLVRRQLPYHCHLHLGFVCKKPGPKLLSVSNQARLDLFVRKEIVIPPEARCCAGHLVTGKLSNDAMQKIKTNDSVLLNRTSVLTMIHSLRELAFEHQRLDVDDESSIDDEDYKMLTGFTQLSTHKKVEARERVLPSFL